MYAKQTTIINKTGLHARPAAEFTRTATKFESKIEIENLDKNKSGDAKSIISVMTMLLSQGTKIEVRAEGDDEQQAVDTLIALVEGGFGEI